MSLPADLESAATWLLCSDITLSSKLAMVGLQAATN